MTFEISHESLKQIIPHPTYSLDVWYQALNDLLPKFEINTRNRVAAFLTHTMYDSSDYSCLRETVNYSSSVLLRLWSRYFNEVTAKAYGNKPEAIANKIYANKMGNGPESSGDGWKYRSGGLIPLSGKQVYAAFAQFAGMDVDDAIDYIETPKGAVHSACWYWKLTNMNELADAEDISSMTKKITGGTIGIDDRIHNYEAIKELL